jgi:hypothetical protein
LTKKKNSVRDGIEGVLKDVIGDLPNDPTPNSPDVVADYLHEVEFGIPRPRQDGNSAPSWKKRSPEEIAEDLAHLKKYLGQPDSERATELARALAKASPGHLPKNHPVRRFLEDFDVRSTIRQLVKESKAEFVEYVKSAKDPQMQTGAPSSTVKKGNWTFVYDENGSLTKCYEGDDEPFIFAN